MTTVPQASSPSARPDHSRFHGRKAIATSDARIAGIPFNPLCPDAAVELNGETYAIEWGSHGGVSVTEALYATVTNRSTGKRTHFPRILFSIKRDKAGNGRVRYNLKGVPGWPSEAAANAGLAQIVQASEQRQAQHLTLSNPIAGAFPVRYSLVGGVL